MLETLITSKTRVQILLRLFTNPKQGAYLRQLAQEFNESTNSIRLELNRLSEAKLLKSEMKGRKKLYSANSDHPLFQELHKLVIKSLGIDKLIESVLAKLGTIDLALLIGDYARGIDSGIIDIVIIGKIDRNYLQDLVSITEFKIDRKIRTLVLSLAEYEEIYNRWVDEEKLVLWTSDAKQTK